MLVITVIFYTLIELYIIVKAFKSNRPIVNQSIILYFSVILFLFFKNKYSLSIPDYSLLLIIISILGHIFIGKFLNYYNKSKHFDRFLHALGCFSFSIFSYCLILSFINPAVNSRLLAGIFTFTIGTTYGLIFEIIEFISDQSNKKKNKQKSQRGLLDTNFDMVFDLFGSLLAAFFTFFILF